MRAIPLGFLTAALTAPALAQNVPERIDPMHSYAKIWMGRDSETSVAVNTGVAQAGGTAKLNERDLAGASLEANLVPGGGGASLLTTEGALRTGEIAPIARYAVMKFRTTAARVRKDGRLELTGDLTVTHVTRDPILGAWNWNYAGSSTYTDPVSKSVTRTVKFVVLTPHAEFIGAYLKEDKEIVAAATIEAGDFPELPAIVLDSDWPIVVQEETCPPPAGDAGRRDYNGVTCTGKGIAVNNPSSPWHSFSRDYSGARQTMAPANGPVTIALHLSFLAPAPGSTAAPDSPAATPAKP